MKLQICKFDYWKIFWCKQSVCAVQQMMLTLCVCVSLHSVCWWSGRSWSGWSPLPARSRGDSRWTGLGETPTTEGDKKQHEVTSVTEEQVEITIRKKEREDETRLWMRETRWRVLKRKRTREIYWDCEFQQNIEDSEQWVRPTLTCTCNLIDLISPTTTTEVPLSNTPKPPNHRRLWL